MAEYWIRNPSHSFIHSQIKKNGWFGDNNPVMPHLKETAGSTRLAGIFGKSELTGSHGPGTKSSEIA